MRIAWLPVVEEHWPSSFKNQRGDQRGDQAALEGGPTGVPAAVDALGGVLEVQLDALVDEAGVARHDDRPARVAGRHAGHVEALLPLLVDPLEGEAVRHLRGAGAKPVLSMCPLWLRLLHALVLCTTDNLRS